MIAAALLASAAAVYMPSGLGGMWAAKGGQLPAGQEAVLRMERDGFAVIRSTYDAKTFAETGQTEMRCVYTGQVPNVFQYSVACDDGEAYTLTLRNPGRVDSSNVENTTIEFDGIVFVYGDGG